MMRTINNFDSVLTKPKHLSNYAIQHRFSKKIPLSLEDFIQEYTTLHICAFRTSNNCIFRTLFGMNPNSSAFGVIQKRIHPFTVYTPVYISDCKSEGYIKINKIIKQERKTMRNYYVQRQVNKFENFLTDYVARTVKSRLSTQLKLRLDQTSMFEFIKWFKQYDKRFKTRISRVSKGNYVFRANDFFITLDNYTFARIRTGDFIKQSLYEIDIINNTSVSNTDVLINIYGRDCFKIATMLEEMTKAKYTVCYKISTKESYRGADGFQTEIYYQELNGRGKNTIFLDEEVKRSLFDHINRFIENEQIYKDRNLLYKTGILLYGEPGTGKSSIANMICSEYNKDMVLINMSDFKNMDVDFITSTINADDKMYVVVLEDIDCVIGDREQSSDAEMQKNINKLLQFLDSSSSPTNVIFVATTNHLEKLDSAITRSGRFDKILYITNISKDPAVKMCESFGLSKERAEEIFESNNNDGKINPALLQNLILEELGNKPVELEEDTIKEVEDESIPVGEGLKMNMENSIPNFD